MLDRDQSARQQQETPKMLLGEQEKCMSTNADCAQRPMQRDKALLLVLTAKGQGPTNQTIAGRNGEKEAKRKGTGVKAKHVIKESMAGERNQRYLQEKLGEPEIRTQRPTETPQLHMTQIRKKHH